jgi:hypothetical protein
VVVVSAGFFCLPPPDEVVVAAVVVGIGEVGEGIETAVSVPAFALVSVWPLESEPQPAASAISAVTASTVPARLSEVTPIGA